MLAYLFLFIAAASAAPARIINGKEAIEGTFTWQVSLQYGISHFCGGSLLSDTVVLTAAHCKVYSIGSTFVAAGSVDRLNPAQLLPVSDYLIHPQYNVPSQFDYDYGIIILAQPADLSHPFIDYIEMVDPVFVDYVDMEVWGIISGWGYHRLSSGFPHTIPEKLQWAHIPIRSSSYCDQVWGSQITFSQRMLCVAGNSVSSACSGDSGGPMVIEDLTKKDGIALVGITSWGESRCGTQYPGAYARVSEVADLATSYINAY